MKKKDEIINNGEIKSLITEDNKKIINLCWEILDLIDPRQGIFIIGNEIDFPNDYDFQLKDGTKNWTDKKFIL